MTATSIQFAPLPDDLKTAYLIRGGGKTTLDRNMMSTVKQSGGGSLWKASKATAQAIVMLDEELRKAGAEGTSMTEVWRHQSHTQAAAREAYMSWVRAGRPAQGAPGWHGGMKTAYVAPAGQSNHGWGGALDENVFALKFVIGGRRYTGNEALAMYWDIAMDLGFTPIIIRPNIHQSEAWHFDHWGPLRDVYVLFRDARKDDPRYGNPYGLAAEVGCVLAGQHPGDHQMERMVQARLLIGGFFCGKPDGVLGRMTRAAMREAELGKFAGGAPASDFLTALDESGIGLKEIWSA